MISSVSRASVSRHHALAHGGEQALGRFADHDQVDAALGRADDRARDAGNEPARAHAGIEVEHEAQLDLRHDLGVVGIADVRQPAGAEQDGVGFFAELDGGLRHRRAGVAIMAGARRRLGEAELSRGVAAATLSQHRRARAPSLPARCRRPAVPRCGSCRWRACDASVRRSANRKVDIGTARATGSRLLSAKRVDRRHDCCHSRIVLVLRLVMPGLTHVKRRRSDKPDLRGDGSAHAPLRRQSGLSLHRAARSSSASRAAAAAGFHGGRAASFPTTSRPPR